MSHYFLLFLILFLLLGAGAILAKNRAAKISKKLQQEWKEQKLIAQQELNVSLCCWLELLDLPQLEEKKKRLEIANQLSIVLIGKLLREPVPCCNSNRLMQ